jgi:outer membrane protein OmpA-like peptidoglycan-associated protein
MAYFTRNILRMEGKPGPDPRGKVWISPDHVAAAWPWPRVRVDLYNYNIDGNVLKPEHKKWLRTQLFPFLRMKKYHVELHGKTSSSGNAEYNRRLSLQRVLLLKEFLLEEGRLSEAQVPGDHMRAHGEQLANQATPEAERDRAVTMIIVRGLKNLPSVRVRIGKTVLGLPPWLKPDQPKPDKPTPRTPPSDKILLHGRYLGGMQAGVSAMGWGEHWFEIYDHEHPYKRRRFMFTGPITQIKSPIAGAATEGSNEWFQFKCSVKSVDDLAGKRGFMIGVGGGNLNPFYLTIPGCGVGNKKIPTGMTIGLGMDKMSGKFIRDTSYNPPIT